MMVLGITGGTGCGKTTLLRSVLSRGGYVIDCDAVYHEMLEHDKDLINALEKCFPGVLENGVLIRKKLGKVVFEDAAALAKLNAAVHPHICREVQRQVEAAAREGYTMIAIDAIALVESGLGALCDATIAVTAPLEARVSRLIAREGVSEAYARLRIAAQKSNEAFAAQCDRTIENDYPSAEAFSEACDTLLTELTGGMSHG